MIAEQGLQGEDTGAAVPPGAGGPAELPDRASPGVDRGRDHAVVDDGALADDHRWLLGADPGKLGKAYLDDGMPGGAAANRPPPLLGVWLGCGRPTGRKVSGP